MDKFEQTLVFINGAKTGIDWLNHKGRLAEKTTTEYEDGFRHCLDAIGGFMEDLVEEEADEPVS